MYIHALRSRLTLLVGGVVFSLLLAPVSAFASHTNGVVLVDDSDTTSDAGGCGNNANPCNTIQAGVDHALAGHKVKVAAGTYDELVQVTKRLAIEGAQKSKDARNRNLAIDKESVVNGGFNLQADKIVLDGFIVEDNAGGPGVQTSATSSGYDIKNNIIRNNVFGLYLHNSGASEAKVSKNLFSANNVTGAANGNAIYSDQGLKDAVIKENKFTLHQNSAFTLTKGSDAQPNNKDVEFQRNESVSDLNTVNLYHSDTIEISRNIIRGTNDPNDGSAIYLAGNNHGVEIERNEIRNRGWTGIVVDNLVSLPNAGVVINENKLRNLDRDGIDVRDNAAVTGGVVVEDNEIRVVARDGIRFGAATAGNHIEDNFVRNGAEHDAHDLSVGTETAGTANTWEDNECVTDEPNGLCENDD